MLSLFQKFAALTLCTSFVVAAPALEKRGGFWDQNGKWVDDGFWAWSHGPKTTEFVPWAASNYESSGSSGSSGSPETYTGNSHYGPATYYYQGGNPGACGNYNSDSAYIAAINSGSYSGSCGKYFTVKNTATGATVTVLGADLCPTCNGDGIDLSVAAFQALGGLDQGVINVEWHQI